MTDYLQQSLTGLGAGAVIAVLAIGLVLTFRASNVVNLAHCAMGMYIAYVYYTLRNFDLNSSDRGGDLILPIIGLPTRVHIVDRPTVVTALAHRADRRRPGRHRGLRTGVPSVAQLAARSRASSRRSACSSTCSRSCSSA